MSKGLATVLLVGLSKIRNQPPVKWGRWDDDLAVVQVGAGALPETVQNECYLEKDPLVICAVGDAVAQEGFPLGLGARG